MKRKWIWIVLIAVVLVVGAVLLIKYRPNGTIQNPNSLSVRLTWVHQAQFAGIYLAADKGFYKELGLNVDIRPGGIEYPSIKMVSAGNDEIGLTSADQVLLARSKGAPVVAIAALYQKSPVVLFSLKKSGITTPHDLKGKKIGIKYGDNTEVPLRALLRKEGISDKDIKEVSVSYDPSPLIQGQVDVLPGFAVNEPLSLTEKGYELNEIFTADYGVNMYADVIFTTEDVIAKKRDALVKFLIATIKGIQYAIDHPDEAIAAVASRNPNMDSTHEMNMLKASIPLWKPSGKRIGEMQEADWVQLNDILMTQGLINQKIMLNQVVNYELLREAYKDVK